MSKASPVQVDYARDPGGDYIVRATALGGKVRALACRTTDTCRDAVRLLDLSPIAAAALGRLMSGVLLLAQDLKQAKQSITALVHGDGPLGILTAVADGAANVRGMVGHPVTETLLLREGKLAVGSAVGKGTLTVIRDLGMKEPYVGRVRLVSGEIAEDLSYYLAVSEQISSIVSLGVKLDQNGVRHAGGLLVQLLPDAGEDTAAYLEDRAAAFPEITQLLEEGCSPQQMLERLLDDADIQYIGLTPCAYRCRCSRQRMTRNLTALGRRELADLAGDPAGIRLECHFCNKTYHFSQAQVQALLEHATETQERRIES
jgi:molecular chaperone Hsp33